MISHKGNKKLYCATFLRNEKKIKVNPGMKEWINIR